MAEHKDPNGAVWQVTIAGPAWVASPADSSDTGYINTFADIDDDRPVGNGSVHLLWPFNKEPALSGKFTSAQPGAAIDAFARANKSKATVRVTGKAPDEAATSPSTSSTGGIPWWGVLAIAYGGYRLIKRATSGRGYRG